MFDTHCHLNFSVFNNNLPDVIDRAKKAGVTDIVIPGADVESSKKAVTIAEQYTNVYAAVGIHPHHVFQNDIESLKEIEDMLPHPKVVAIGEVGLDRHMYTKTKYTDYQIDEDFMSRQKEFLDRQINLAAQYRKTLILHNREAKHELLEILNIKLSILHTIPIVFHCCEPDFAKASPGKPDSLLEFAKKHHIYIGVDGDVTYNEGKQEFVKKIPSELLVLETDAPFLKPFGMKFPNEPKNIPIIAEFIAETVQKDAEEIKNITFANAEKLFYF